MQNTSQWEGFKKLSLILMLYGKVFNNIAMLSRRTIIFWALFALWLRWIVARGRARGFTICPSSFMIWQFEMLLSKLEYKIVFSWFHTLCQKSIWWQHTAQFPQTLVQGSSAPWTISFCNDAQELRRLGWCFCKTPCRAANSHVTCQQDGLATLVKSYSK